MKIQNTNERILHILAQHPSISEPRPESNLLRDFNLSSLEIAELVCRMEDELEIEIPECKLRGIQTVSDIFAALEDC